MIDKLFFSSFRLFLFQVVCLLVGILCSSQTAIAQNLTDTVIAISEVRKTGAPVFKKETAGMKETEVDSLVLMEKSSVSLSELLSENTPVFIKSHGRGALATASFRGTAASHTKVSWNGININNPMSGMVDFSLIPVYLIDDLSLKHGTASIADNSGGLGGSIAIENAVCWNDTLKLKYMQGIGSYSTYDEYLQAGLGNKKLQWRMRLYHNYSANDYTYLNRGAPDIDPETGKVTIPLDTNENADYTKFGMMQELYWRVKETGFISVQYWGQNAERTIPRATSYEGPNNANLNRQTDTDHKLVASWKQYGEHYKLSARTGYSAKDMLYAMRNLVVGSEMQSAIYSVSEQRSSLNNINYTYTFSRKLSLNASVDANAHNVSSEDTVAKTGYAGTRSELSAFVAGYAQLHPRLNVNLMLRQELIDGEIEPVIPYAGFDLRLIKKKDLILKGNIARNYRQPTLNDLYWQPGGNADLKPEEGISTELGLEHQIVWTKSNLHMELTAYCSDIDNWIIWLPSLEGYWEPMNIRRVLSQGAEASAKLGTHIGIIGVNVLASYAYTSSRNFGDKAIWGDDSYGKQLVYVPLHSANLMVNLQYKKLFATYQHNSYSERFTSSSNNASKRDWLYPYFMNDLMFGRCFEAWKLKGSAEFKVYNLFDEVYHSVLYRPMPQRNYMLVLRVEF